MRLRGIVVTDSSETRQLIRQQLEDLHRAGIRQLPAPAGAALNGAATGVVAGTATGAEAAAKAAPEIKGRSAEIETTEDTARPRQAAGGTETMAGTGQKDGAVRPGKRLSKKARQELLDDVHGRVKACQKCHELCTSRTQTVFGVGNPSSRLVFLGEAPGADEDRLGEPFVGRAGKLLDKIIEACTLSRQDVYILNILKCRPPGNRNPSDEESANCDEFLQAQLDIIQPDFICCLGSVAAKNLLKTQVPIGKLRGKFHDWRGIRVLATYHPAYLLRNPSAKADVWKDMQILMKSMGIELPKKGKM